jgi:replication initiation and membrane attachment protein DnaB
MKANVYYTIFSSDFHNNIENLETLYTPILGPECISLFNAIVNDFSRQQKIGPSYGTKIASLLKQCRLTTEKFVQCKNCLEAIGLLKTFHLCNEKENAYYFLAISPKNFNKFTDNQEFKKLLISKIGDEDFERYEFLFAPKHIPIEATNISSTFESIFGKDIENIGAFNYDKMMEDISKTIENVFTFSPMSKIIIESFNKSYVIS